MSKIPVTTAGPTDKPTLTELDRCDRCGARAYVRAIYLSLGRSDLLFCGHHWREHGPKVSLTMDSHIDETHHLPAHANLVPVGD